MMRPLACVLLISSLLAQGAALPHSHTGSDVHEPADHDLRPHFHVSGCHHSHHAHAVAPRPPRIAHAKGVAHCYGLPPCDHDHDAVYVCSGGDMNLMERASACLALVDFWHVSTGACSPDVTSVLSPWATVTCGDSVPIFLASTRLLV